MLDARDRAFLEELVQFTIMKHGAVMRLYRQNLAHLSEAARLTEDALRSYTSGAELAEAVAKNHDEARIERILIAKMFAELIVA